MAIIILYTVGYWGNRLRVADANTVNKLIRNSSDVSGVKWEPMMVVSERRILLKVKAILDNESKPFNDVLIKPRSSFSGRQNAS